MSDGEIAGLVAVLAALLFMLLWWARFIIVLKSGRVFGQ